MSLLTEPLNFLAGPSFVCTIRTNPNDKIRFDSSPSDRSAYTHSNLNIKFKLEFKNGGFGSEAFVYHSSGLSCSPTRSRFALASSSILSELACFQFTIVSVQFSFYFLFFFPAWFGQLESVGKWRKTRFQMQI